MSKKIENWKKMENSGIKQPLGEDTRWKAAAERSKQESGREERDRGQDGNKDKHI